ncbi:hypothetical protein LCGC14_2729960, partial [marine sediment metagenome]
VKKENIIDIKAQISKEEAALKRTRDVRKKFAEEIALAQKQVGLSQKLLNSSEKS